MDRKKLVEEILEKVLEEIEKLERVEHSANSSINKSLEDKKSDNIQGNGKQILILSHDQRSSCLDSLAENGLLRDNILIIDENDNSIGSVDIGNYKEIVVCSLSNLELTKLSTGFCDSHRLKLIEKAIMAGANVHIAIEGIQFISEGANAPRAFQRGYRQKLDKIKSWGINVFSEGDIKKSLEKSYSNLHSGTESSLNYFAGSDSVDNICSNKIVKRFVTQRDVEKLHLAGYVEIVISPQGKVTDIAREYAEKNNIVFKFANQ